MEYPEILSKLKTGKWLSVNTVIPSLILVVCFAAFLTGVIFAYSAVWNEPLKGDKISFFFGRSPYLFVTLPLPLINPTQSTTKEQSVSYPANANLWTGSLVRNKRPTSRASRGRTGMGVVAPYPQDSHRSVRSPIFRAFYSTIQCLFRG